MENRTKLFRMPEKQLRELQEDRIKNFLGTELAERHPAYRDVWQQSSRPRTLSELEKLPFTHKEDLLPGKGTPENYKRYVLEPPEKSGGGSFFGKMFGKKTTAEPAETYAFNQLMFSAGRTGRITPNVYSTYDIQQLTESGLRMMELLGLTRDDTMVNAMPYAPNLSFWQIYYATVGLGSTALQTGGGRILGLEKILKALDNMEASVLFTTPGYAEFLLQSCIYFKLKLPALQHLIVGYAPAPLPLVHRLTHLLRLVGHPDGTVRRLYAMNEAKAAWVECSAGQGYHYYADHALMELVEPTDSADALSDSKELVLTNLDVKGTCVVRLRSGDLADAITFETCPACKRTLPRISGDIQRLHDIRSLAADGEQVVNFNKLYSLMAAEPTILLWQAQVEPGGLGLQVSFRDKEEAAKTAAELPEKISAALGLTPQLIPASYRELVESLGLEKYPVEKRIVYHTS